MASFRQVRFQTQLPQTVSYPLELSSCELYIYTHQKILQSQIIYKTRLLTSFFQILLTFQLF